MLGTPRGTGAGRSGSSARPLSPSAQERPRKPSKLGALPESPSPHEEARNFKEDEARSTGTRSPGDFCGPGRDGGAENARSLSCSQPNPSDGGRAKEGLEGSGFQDSPRPELTSVLSPAPGVGQGLVPGVGPAVFNEPEQANCQACPSGGLGEAVLGVGPAVFDEPEQINRRCTDPSVGLGEAGQQQPALKLLQLLTGEVVQERRPSVGFLLSAGLPGSQSILQLGITALQLLFFSPRDGQLLESCLCNYTQKAAAPILRQRDLLPLPLPPIGAALQLLELCCRTPEGLLEWRPTPAAKRRRLGEILPGLPADGVAGSLEAASVARGEVRSWLLEPSQCILPEEQWPDPLPIASMNCTREEWCKVARVLVEKQILAPIDRESIFRVRGEPLLNGVFTVEKKGVAAPGEHRITRLIMNCVPSNSIQRLMVGDLPTLSASSQWTAAYLRPSQVLLWSGDDQRGAYYAWALPADWRPFMAFRWPVPGHVVGCPDQREVFLASAVIPMGWKNAVSLFQHLHRQLGLSPVPAGAGLPPDWEWRRDRPVPGSAVAEGGGWIQYYLDDFDAPEFVDRTDWQRLRGILSATHRRQREAYARKGVGISQDKAHVRELAVNRMGAT